MLCKNLKLKLIAIFSILLSCFNLMADDIVFTLTAPQTAEVGEMFRVKFELNAKGSDFKEPNFSDFQVISGPNTSSSSSIDWVNGKMIQNITNTYTFILMVNNEGEYTIPPAIIKSNGKTYQSNFVDIIVVAGSNTNTNNYQQHNPQNSPISLSNNNDTKDDDDDYNKIKERIRREIYEDMDRINERIMSNKENNNLLTNSDYHNNIETRYNPYQKSKYDDKISWTYNSFKSNDVGDLRAEAQGGWGRFKDAIIGDEIYRGKEYESKSPGEKVFTGIFWADVLQKSRPILLILIVVAIVIFVRCRR